MISTRIKKKHSNCTVTLSNLIPVASQPQTVSSNVSTTLHLALLNIRSLSGKSLLFNDFITKNNLDFMCLTETLLNEQNTAVVLIEVSPLDFYYINEARIVRKGGGVPQIKHIIPTQFVVCMGVIYLFGLSNTRESSSPSCHCLIVYNQKIYL